MDKGKSLMQEEDCFLTLLLSNQTSYSLAVADTIEQSLEMQNVAQADESSKQFASETMQPLRFRKAIPPHVLRDLAVHDPKRARRIIANRLSAAKAKEKKKLHICTLEQEVQSLQSEWNSTSAQLALVQSENQSLTDESSRLKERVSMILQRINLQDELNEQIRKEVQHLKMMIQCVPNFEYRGYGYNHARDAQLDYRTQQ